jgi:hypothetical protein
MVAAGVVKLTSGDPLWRSLDALTVHYETQPLPTPLGWYAHHLPAVVQQVCTAGVLLVELLLPWLIFGGRLLRTAAAVGLMALQVLIGATGNYAFFNLLTIGLLLPLLDDLTWQRCTGRARGPDAPLGSRLAGRPRRWVPAAVVALATLPVSLGMPFVRSGFHVPGASVLEAWGDRLRPFRSVNSYGLFAVMTPTRPEIIIEGSSDGLVWTPYEFPYKPGNVQRAPSWIAPHQPRLDWLMWFAALDRYEASPWLERLCRRLLEGAPAVTALFAANPFPGAPPRFVRALRAEYHMASIADRLTHGIWWTRDTPRRFSPVMSLAPDRTTLVIADSAGDRQRADARAGTPRLLVAASCTRAAFSVPTIPSFPSWHANS